MKWQANARRPSRVMGDLKVGQTQQDKARERQKIQQQLDEALEDSFPASDPVSIVTSNDEEYWGTEPRISDDSKKPGA